MASKNDNSDNSGKTIPKYEQLIELLKTRISNGYYQIGQQLPSESELVKELECSRHTVLKGLAGLAAEGWIERHQGKGTFVASRFTQTTSSSRNVIAFVNSDQDQFLFQQVARGINKFSGAVWKEVLLLNPEHDAAKEQQLVMELGQRGIGGAVIWPLFSHENSLKYETLYKHGFPMVFVDRGLEGTSIPVVCTDHEYGAYEMVKYLISLGHKRIAHVTFEIATHEGYNAVTLREAGYRRALGEAGIAVREDYICRVNPEIRQLAHIHSVLEMIAYEQVHKLINMHEPPTAIFLLNDQFAPSVFKVLTNEGLNIPGDISIAGFDNDPYAWEMARPITTYVQPATEIGQSAAELLDKMMQGQKIVPNLIIKLPGKLLARDTTAKPGIL